MTLLEEFLKVIAQFSELKFMPFDGTISERVVLTTSGRLTYKVICNDGSQVVNFMKGVRMLMYYDYLSRLDILYVSLMIIQLNLNALLEQIYSLI